MQKKKAIDKETKEKDLSFEELMDIACSTPKEEVIKSIKKEKAERKQKNNKKG